MPEQSEAVEVDTAEATVVPRLQRLLHRDEWAVSAGAIFGVWARYVVGVLVGQRIAFPAATLLINLVGCMLIGIVQTLFLHKAIRRELQLFAVVGVLGGFTTFSTFSWETLQLIQTGHIMRAGVYQLLSLGGGVIGVALGIGLARGRVRN